MPKVRKSNTGNVMVDLSSPQNSLLGEFVGDVHYRSEFYEMYSKTSSGFPHNGGQHTLRLTGSKPVVTEMLNMLSLINEVTRDIAEVEEILSGLRAEVEVL